MQKELIICIIIVIAIIIGNTLTHNNTKNAVSEVNKKLQEVTEKILYAQGETENETGKSFTEEQKNTKSVEAEEKENTNWRQRKIWYRNGGMVTHEQLKHYRKDTRSEIFDFIWKLPTNLEVEVNGIKYKLVHASPEENYMANYWHSEDYKDSREFAVWERWNETCPVPGGYVLIFGHTPTCYFHNREPWSIWKSEKAIGIDCGGGFEYGRLSCLRLDDMQEFYSEE